MTEYLDLFSNHAECYASSRPTYPQELFSYLASLVPEHELAWDVGTGNGQAAVGLVEHFKHVIATDGSAGQIAQARPHERIEYRVATGEDADLAAGSADLITIAQALHWFRHDAFYANARRVAKPGGVIAAWCYTLPRVSAEVDAVCDYLYSDVGGAYWESGRKFIDQRYETIPFPFKEIRPTPKFACRMDWTLAEYVNYICSWSAVQAYRKKNGSDPVQIILPRLTTAWGNAVARRVVMWPIYMRVGHACRPA